MWGPTISAIRKDISKIIAFAGKAGDSPSIDRAHPTLPPANALQNSRLHKVFAIMPWWLCAYAKKGVVGQWENTHAPPKIQVKNPTRYPPRCKINTWLPAAKASGACEPSKYAIAIIDMRKASPSAMF